MATEIIPGQTTWSMTRDETGERDYKITFLVRGLSTDGPVAALDTPGLPRPGAPWNFDGDYDPWAYCRANATITPKVTKEPNRFFEIELLFSTKGSGDRCQDNQKGDPLLEPQRISGTYTKLTEEATHDRFGKLITNSAFEQIRGPQVEFDANRPTVKIQQNVPVLGITLWSPMIDTVNDRPLWGLPARCIKLSNVTWEYKYHGQCQVYYSRTFDYDINPNTFDRGVLDEGTKVLSGHWDPVTGNYVLDPVKDAPGGEWSPGLWEPGIEENWIPDTNAPPNPNRDNPAHFIRFKDRNGENARVILDGYGLPFNPPAEDTTDTCSECDPGVAPSKWAVFGLETTEDVILDHTTGCEWESSDVDVGLSVIGSGWNVRQVDADGNVSEWRNTNLDCSNPNVLVLASGEGPLTITIFPVPKAVPGERAIEKYDESNFLLLGIPAQLEPGINVGALGQSPSQL